MTVELNDVELDKLYTWLESMIEIMDGDPDVVVYENLYRKLSKVD